MGEGSGDGRRMVTKRGNASSNISFAMNQSFSHANEEEFAPKSISQYIE